MITGTLNGSGSRRRLQKLGYRGSQWPVDQPQLLCDVAFLGT